MVENIIFCKGRILGIVENKFYFHGNVSREILNSKFSTSWRLSYKAK